VAGNRSFRQTGVDENGMPTYEEIAPVETETGPAPQFRGDVVEEGGQRFYWDGKAKSYVPIPAEKFGLSDMQFYDLSPAERRIYIQGALDRMRQPGDRAETSGQAELTAQDQEALKWANANPNDPRAAKIRERLGR
jgi:hypothetical protein